MSESAHYALSVRWKSSWEAQSHSIYRNVISDFHLLRNVVLFYDVLGDEADGTVFLHAHVLNPFSAFPPAITITEHIFLIDFVVVATYKKR